MESWPNVYEFDLTGFFDNVRHSAIEEVLCELGVPTPNVAEFMNLCRSIPELCEEDLKEEIDRSYKFLSDGRLNPHHDPTRYLGDYKNIGVPQGAAISCGLSILVNLYQTKLRTLEGGRKMQCVYFADDGLAFMSHLGMESNVDSPRRGLVMNVNKSHEIKREGKYVVENLKFVGFNLNLKTGEFSSRTRSGKSLILTPKWRSYLLLTSELTNLATQYKEDWLNEVYYAQYPRSSEDGKPYCLREDKGLYP